MVVHDHDVHNWCYTAALRTNCSIYLEVVSNAISPCLVDFHAPAANSGDILK